LHLHGVAAQVEVEEVLFCRVGVVVMKLLHQGTVPYVAHVSLAYWALVVALVCCPPMRTLSQER